MPRRLPLRDLLTGGDRRSIGRVAQVIERVHRTPGLVHDLVALLPDDDPLVRMRAADALEKVSADSPSILWNHRRTLLALARTATQAELRWHLAQMLPRLPLTAPQRREAVRVLRRYLRDGSRIVRTMAMQSLADLAAADAGLRRSVLPLLEHLTRAGSPAMRARGRHILGALGRPAAAAKGNPRPLWTCPRCRRRFANRNQSHACAHHDLAHHFQGKDPAIRALFDALRRAIADCGPVTVLPEKTRIAFQVRMSFAQVSPRRHWLDGHVVFARRLPHPRFRKIETISPRNHVHHFRLTTPDEIDAEFREWLREAHAVGGQEHLRNRPARRTKP